MEIDASIPLTSYTSDYAGDYDDDRIEVTTFGDCLIKLNNDVLEFDNIGKLFLSNFADFGKKICINIEAINKMNWSNSRRMSARLECFNVCRGVLLENCDKYVDGVTSCMKSAWYCGSKEEIQRIVSHGFGHHQLGNSHGICFTPLNRLAQSLRNCVVDDDGFKHVLLCRVLIEDGVSMTKLESEDVDEEVNSPSVYVVWDTKMNTHILPEYVVTFRTDQCLEGNPKAGQKRKMQEASLWMPFPSLVDVLSKRLSPHTMTLINEHYTDFKHGKISRPCLIEKLRRCVGNDLLIKILKSHGIKERKKPVFYSKKVY